MSSISTPNQRTQAISRGLRVAVLLVIFDIVVGDQIPALYYVQLQTPLSALFTPGFAVYGLIGQGLLIVSLIIITFLFPYLLVQSPFWYRPYMSGKATTPTAAAVSATVTSVVGWTLLLIILSALTRFVAEASFKYSGALLFVLLLHALAFLYIGFVVARGSMTETRRIGAVAGLVVALAWGISDIIFIFTNNLDPLYVSLASVIRLVIFPALGYIAGGQGGCLWVAEGRISPQRTFPAGIGRSSVKPGGGLLWMAVGLLLAVVFLPPPYSPIDAATAHTASGRFAQFGSSALITWSVMLAGAASFFGLVRGLRWAWRYLAGTGRIVQQGILYMLAVDSARLHSKGLRRLLAGLVLTLVFFWPYIDQFMLGGGTDARVSTLSDIGFYVILALGLNVVVGFAGLLDLGYVAFFAFGAYVWAMFGAPEFSKIGILVHRLDGFPIISQHLPFGLLWAWWFWPMLLIGALVAAGFGVLLGVPTLRLRGDYLAIVTLGFGEIVPIVFKNIPKLTEGTNGINGVPSPIIPGLSFPWFAATPYYYLILVLIAVTIICTIHLRDSRLGRAWAALREDEIAAATSGVNTVKIKLLAFGTGAFFSGMAGVYHASKLGIIDPGQFNFGDSIAYMAMVVLGGIGSIPGVIIGAFVIGSLNLYLLVQLNVLSHDPSNVLYHIPFLNAIDFANIRNIIFGSILITMMLLRPEGLIPDTRRRAELHGEVAEKGEESPQDSMDAAIGQTASIEERMQTAETGKNLDSHEPLIEIKGLTRSFGGLLAVSNLDLRVYPGEIVSIIGPNGAGKTTVFDLITGLYNPDSILDGRSNRILEELRLAVQRFALMARRRPRALLRWFISTLMGMGLGALFTAYILNVIVDAALSDESYLHNIVLVCTVCWLLFWPLNSFGRQFLGSANGFWAELDTTDTGVGGFHGSIRLRGSSLLGLTPDAVLARGVARTYQNIRLFNNMTVLENVQVGRHTHLRASLLATVFRTSRARHEEVAVRHKAIELLGFFGPELVARQDEIAANLSYAEKRRVEICRALAADPQLLLLDEPTAGMNDTEIADAIHYIRRLCDERGLTILLIEHKLTVTMGISDRIVVLDYGRKIAEGPPDEVRKDERVIEAYLGRKTGSG